MRQDHPIGPPNTKSDEAQSRRLRRYSLAEHALATTLQSCADSEASTQELQIRTLERATSLLGAYAEDAKERVGKLRMVLADREVDPDTHQALKRERWMEERRQVAVAEVANEVQQQLVSLSQSIHIMPPAPTPTSSAETRRRANLQLFFESSRSQVHSHVGRPHSMYSEPSTRRMTLESVTPMRLRTSFMSMRSRTLKPFSLDAQRANDNIPPKSQPTPMQPAPSVDHPVASIRGCPDLPRISEQRELSSDGGPVSHGTATIFPTDAHQVRELVALDVDVSIPDYALDLFTNFDINYAVPPLPSIPTLRHQFEVPVSGPDRQLPSLLKSPEPRPIYKPRSRLSLLRKPSFQWSPYPVEEGPDNNQTTRNSKDCNIKTEPSPCPSTTSLGIGVSEGIIHPELIANKIRKRFSAVLRRR
ncbi:hypothetical protein BD779DRAFT_601983 [Infundibulicybe gibba]|nr:hypothetical protein BD779DRAFT_601983 [Infundibulicybe gibba]